ncbi:MAG TPA: amidase [Planctomycetaceae bacterium]|nr:amidase [Planctomycetaceae bacterium]
MQRRRFLQGAAATTLGIAAGKTCGASHKDQANGPVSEAPQTPIVEASIGELQQSMARGETTARQLVEWYLERIDALDRAGPKLRSVVEVNPQALEIAERLDTERREGKIRGPLHGIPILIKDNIETGDRMRTTAGSLALADWRAPRDSGVAARLRKAGAILLGKTNLSEWANFRSTRSTSGWSGRGGLTRNPYALDRNPCGSSSGSAVAAAASLCAAAVGTETNGSIVCPSSINGVVGIKPTLGQVSRAGIIPLAHSQDTAGPIARTVADAALLLAAMAGPDPRDAVTTRRSDHYTFDPGQLDPQALHGRKIGVARNFFGFHERVDAVMEKALGALTRAGAKLVEELELRAKGLGRAGFDVLLYEFKADINAYLKGVAPELPAHSLEELIEFNREHAKEEMPFFGQELFEMAQEKGSLEEPAYQEALAKMRRAYREEGIDKLITEHRLDCIVAPTTGPAWVTDLIHGDHGSGGSSSPAARAGYPNITVPMGYVFGLPVGISFIGPAFSEPKLVSFAYAFEQAIQVRHPPRFLPTAELENGEG